MTEEIFSDQSVLEGLRSGPLGHQVDSFTALLREQGYARSTRREKIRLVGAMSNGFSDEGWEWATSTKRQSASFSNIAVALTDLIEQLCVR